MSGTMARVRYLLKIGVTAVALWITTLLFDDIRIDAETGIGAFFTLLLVALIFGVVNTIIKPVATVILKVGCVYYLTLGLIGLVLNAALFLLVLFLADQFDIPFAIDGNLFHRFWIALLASIVIAVVSWVLNLAIPDKKNRD